MDAYREPAGLCDHCAISLREFGARWVCDQCHRMLIGDADFARAVHELDGETAPLVAEDVREGGRPCPHCGGATTSCTLTIGELALRGRFLHCSTHGVWMPQSVMTAVFALASRRAHGGAGGPRTYGGVAGGSALPGALSGAPSSIGEAFGSGPASAGLAIASGRGIAHVHSIYVSAYKERTLGCPSCEARPLDYQGDRWACTGCGGTFVENAALVGLVEDLTGAPWQLPDVPATVGKRACPLCSEAMATETIAGIVLDHCVRHGVWFDARELQALLEQASAPEPRSVGGWLARVFHRGA